MDKYKAIKERVFQVISQENTKEEAETNDTSASMKIDELKEEELLVLRSQVANRLKKYGYVIKGSYDNSTN